MNLYRLTVFMMAFFATAPVWCGDWPQFRGPNRDNISTEAGLLKAWPAGGPKVLWKIDVCEGYAGAAIKAGRVYVNDYDNDKKEHLVRCLSLEDGKEIWQWRRAVEVRPNHGITRTVPAVGEKLLFSLDPKCGFYAIDAETGKLAWEKNLTEEYKVEIPPWYAGQNPLLDGDRVLLATGGREIEGKFEGDTLAVALDQATGKEVWRAPNSEEVLMSHSSLMPTEIGGIRQYLYLHMKGALGISAEDGKLLWSSKFRGRMAVSPSPVSIGDGRIFLTSGYNAGSEMIQVKKSGDSFAAKSLYFLSATKFNSEVHTPILYKEHLFAVSNKKFRGLKTRNRGPFTCLSLDGKIVWESPKDESILFGLGAFLLADGMFFLLEGDTGNLRLIEASTKEYKELASAQILQGHDVWGPLALSNGKLVLRDMGQMVCIQVGGTEVSQK